MKYFTLLVLFTLYSCGNKEAVLLPKANTTIVKNVDDLSPIYIFFSIKNNDTLAEVNRKNSIISTNWILNIDKRLPLRIVIPEIMKLQQKKREEKAHKNEKAENYYSYADTIGKNLAFLPFTKIYYRIEKPKSAMIVFFTKNNEIQVNNRTVKREELKQHLTALSSDKPRTYFFCFAKNMSFGTYLQNEILIQSLNLQSLELQVDKQEFVY